MFVDVVSLKPSLANKIAFRILLITIRLYIWSGNNFRSSSQQMMRMKMRANGSKASQINKRGIYFTILLSYRHANLEISYYNMPFDIFVQINMLSLMLLLLLCKLFQHLPKVKENRKLFLILKPRLYRFNKNIYW